MKLLLDSRSRYWRMFKGDFVYVPPVKPEPEPEPEPLFLDTVGVAAKCAYSFRKLSTANSSVCLRLRRSSDNALQDFGFVDNYLNRTAVNTWLGGASGYIQTWYDQSGGGNNLSQSVASLQPIYSTSYFDGKSAIDTTGGKFLWNGALTSNFQTGGYHSLNVLRHLNYPVPSYNAFHAIASGNNQNRIVTYVDDDQGDPQYFTLSGSNINYHSTHTVRVAAPRNILIENAYKPSTTNRYTIINGTQVLNANNAITFNQPLSKLSLGCLSFNGTTIESNTNTDSAFAELIIFNTELASPMSANINTYYGIY